MGGTISVTSQLGKGSRFLVTLPLLPPVGAAPAGGPRAGAGRRQTGSARCACWWRTTTGPTSGWSRRCCRPPATRRTWSTNGREAVEAVLRRPLRRGADGRADAGHGRRAGDAPHPRPAAAGQRRADRGADRGRGDRRRGPLSRRRHGRLPQQAAVAGYAGGDARGDRAGRGGGRGRWGRRWTGRRSPACAGSSMARSSPRSLRSWCATWRCGSTAWVRGLRRASWSRRRGEAHDLVSVAGNCGACAVSTLARAVEQAARRGDAAEARTVVRGNPRRRRPGGRGAGGAAGLRQIWPSRSRRGPRSGASTGGSKDGTNILE